MNQLINGCEDGTGLIAVSRHEIFGVSALSVQHDMCGICPEPKKLKF